MVIIRIEHGRPNGWVEGADMQQLREAVTTADVGGEYRWLAQWLDQHADLAPGCHQIAEHYWLLI